MQTGQQSGQKLDGIRMFSDVPYMGVLKPEDLFSDVPYRRELNPGDLERMGVPRRYWKSSFDDIADNSGEDSLKSLVYKYLLNMKDMFKAGAGFILWGGNGTGKSSASVVIAKEYRRRGKTVLFLEAADLKRLVIERQHFDDSETYIERAKNVDVLIIDDFGKGIIDTTGFGASLFDELIRTRNSNKKVTIITSNLDPLDWRKELELKKSTTDTLVECTIPVKVECENQRIASGARLRSMLS